MVMCTNWTLSWASPHCTSIWKFCGTILMIWYLCEHRVVRQDLFVAEAKSGTRRAHATLLGEGGHFRCIGPNAKKTQKKPSKATVHKKHKKRKTTTKNTCQWAWREKFQKTVRDGPWRDEVNSEWPLRQHKKCMPTYNHTYIHAYIHPSIHTSIHTAIHT